MKEINDIVVAFDVANRQNLNTALATVVHVDGSSYRRAGARMLITENGQLTGAISGGCLEGDAMRKARLAMIKQETILLKYDTNGDDESQLGVQLGCNGIIHILVEPINSTSHGHAIDLLKNYLLNDRPAVLVTVFNMANRLAKQYGTCLLMDDAGMTRGALPAGISPVVLDYAFSTLRQDRSAGIVYQFQDEQTFFIEQLSPVTKLVIAGAGNDTLPLVRMAKLMGWRVTIADGRPAYVSEQRFPEADQRLIARPEQVIEQIKVDEATVFMLMTHNYNYDLLLLSSLLPLETPFIGVLGPKKRLHKMLAELLGEDVATTDTSHVFGPAGLDIGSETPEQIALSILAQIQAVLNRLNAMPLKEKAVVHNRENKWFEN